MPTLWIKSWRGEKEEKKGKTWKASRKMEARAMEEEKKGKCCARIYVLISRTSILLKRVRAAANVHSNRSSSVVEWAAAFIYIEIDEWMRNDIINKSLRTSANRFLACSTFATFKHSNSLSHFRLTELILPPLFRLLVQRTFTIATHPC